MDALSNLLDGPMSVDSPQQPQFSVIRDQGLSLFSVDPEAVSYGILPVVVPLKEATPAVITTLRPRRRFRINMEHRATGPTNSATGQPSDQILLGYLNADHTIQRSMQKLQDFRERFGLPQRPGKPVKNVPVSAIESPQSLFDNLNDDSVWNECAFRHDRLGGPSQRRVIGHRFPQEIAGRDMGGIKLGRQQPGLRPLASARRTQQHEPHNPLPQPAFNSTLFQESLIVTHEQVGLDLLYGIRSEEHTS